MGKVVFASTGGAVYGEQERFPATEDHPQYPFSPYGVSKLAWERYLYYYHAQYGLPYVASATQTSMVLGRTHTVRQGWWRSSAATWPRAGPPL